MAKGSIHTDKVIEDLRKNALPLSIKCTKDEKVCSRANTEKYCCTTYFDPEAAWRRSDCLMADDHLKTVKEESSAQKVRVGQQKQKKKARKK